MFWCLRFDGAARCGLEALCVVFESVCQLACGGPVVQGVVPAPHNRCTVAQRKMADAELVGVRQAGLRVQRVAVPSALAVMVT